MTSSLVGSEMCIRDSPQNRPLDGGDMNRGVAKSNVDREAKEPLGRLRSCLLYTSNAADDM
eukprot:1613108-Prorocentrum_lima.AAC.1